MKFTDTSLGTLYSVTFKRPIGSCAAQAQPGYAGGNLEAGPYISEVTDDGPNTFDLSFHTVDGTKTASAFMLTVTCPS